MKKNKTKTKIKTTHVHFILPRRLRFWFDKIIKEKRNVRTQVEFTYVKLSTHFDIKDMLDNIYFNTCPKHHFRDSYTH